MEKESVTYRCKGSKKCELRERCTSSSRGRGVKRLKGDELKEGMNKVFENERARAIYSKRKAMVEPVFSELRSRHGLNRFHRYGMRGVKLEFSLHCIAYNINRAIIEEERGIKAIRGIMLMIMGQARSKAIIILAICF